MSVKRVQDLGYAGLWCLPAFLSGFLLLAAQSSGLAGPADALNALNALKAGGTVLFWPSNLAALVDVVWLGFLRDTIGPNAHGPNPVAGVA